MMLTAHPKFTNKQISQRAHEIYNRSLRNLLEPGQIGRYVVINIETGEYEVGDHYFDSLQLMRSRDKNAALHVLRIGYPAAIFIGGKRVRATEYSRAV